MSGGGPLQHDDHGAFAAYVERDGRDIALVPDEANSCFTPVMACVAAARWAGVRGALRLVLWAAGPTGVGSLQAIGPGLTQASAFNYAGWRVHEH